MKNSRKDGRSYFSELHFQQYNIFQISSADVIFSKSVKDVSSESVYFLFLRAGVGGRGGGSGGGGTKTANH